MASIRQTSVSKPGRKAPARARAGSGKLSLPLALLYTFGCGVGSGLLLLAFFAFLFEKTSLSLTLVQPFACVAAALCSGVSGMVLASLQKEKRLLYGLCCGVFYALCALVATLLTGPLALEGSNLTLLGALLAGGMAGGAFSALHGSAAVR
ncbi:MAG: TIGR04086 family membrane protein [Gemmiger sp.]|nr:TIGR04086 family membrane protein [Gemmiger sp.]